MTENPNDILLTEDGHPIGEVVLADNSSLPQFPPQRTIEEENKEELLRAEAQELTGSPDADAAIAELYGRVRVARADVRRGHRAAVLREPLPGGGVPPVQAPERRGQVTYGLQNMMPEHGQCRSVKGTPVVVFEDGFVVTPRHPTGYFGYIDRYTGYRKVSVRRRSVYVHRLVFEAFVNHIPSGLEIDHIDGSRTNNRLSNLRVVTKRENAVSNPISAARRLVASRANIKKAKASQLRPVVCLSDSGETEVFQTMKDAARSTGTCEQSISKACRGIIKRAGGYKWNYSR